MSTHHGHYKIQTTTNPTDLTHWTQAQYDAFINTEKVLHDTLFPQLPPPPPPRFPPPQTAAATPSPPTQPTTSSSKSSTQPPTPSWAAPNDSSSPTTLAAAPASPSTESTPPAAEQYFAQRMMDEFQGRRAWDMNGPHARLDICFRTPVYKRRGVASALVSWGLERADRGVITNMVCLEESFAGGVTSKQTESG